MVIEPGESPWSLTPDKTKAIAPPPHFIIIGTQKGGTNSLYQYLCQHPQILPAASKEIHYFTLNYHQPAQWYQSQFPRLSHPQQLTGEGSPYYLYHPAVPQRLHQYYPQVKLIVLLRNPVDRAISHYYWEVKLGCETLCLEKAIAAEAQRLEGEQQKLSANGTYYSFNHQHYSYLDRGIYVQQLQRWMAIFPRSQFLIIRSEDLYSNPETVVNQVFNFLDLPPYHQGHYNRYNAGNYSPVSPQLRQQLQAYFQPYNLKLREFLGQDLGWDSHDKLNPSTVPPQEVKPKTVSDTMKIDYEGAWDDYAQTWVSTNPDFNHIGDEWIGKAAGAAQSRAEYEQIIENTFIAPYIQKHHRVLEIGIGGGKTAALLLKYCDRLTCADISEQMLQATRDRLGEDRVNYVKLDGITLDGIRPASLDVCFCYDTMVHIEPRDIFNYLTRIPPLLKGDRLCIFHHTNTLSDLGWQKFLVDWDQNLLGRRQGTAFSIMTDQLMAKFLNHIGYEILHQDSTTVPRDCVWVCRAPVSPTVSITS
ncbi:MAG: methyltransferase domain-containing protein [Arthrospira sp. PLM2.Bin9]|nr:MAG: methyltransferase domain-containing protein [Arthrospira sp. PLM2.Bin9]